MGGWSKLHNEEIHSLYSSPIINLIKAVPLHATQVLAGEKYSSYSFLTSALNGGEWSESRPGCALVPGKGHLVPTGQEAGWAPEPVLTEAGRKILMPLPGIESRSPGHPLHNETL
jgi:hypothetical protein